MSKHRTYTFGPDFEERLLWKFTHMTRPVYLGELSLEVGHGLAAVEYALVSLIERGAVKKLSGDECSALGLRKDANLYILVDGSRFTVRPRPV